MSEKVRWGVLGVAKIATAKVIPAMQGGRWTEVTAIASRDLERARRAAASLGIRKAYGSYEALLDDPDIEAIYNPLPNQLHVPWSIRAAEAGKHVLCEKPIGLSADEARTLLSARDRTGVKIQEAFMVRWHPQWIGAQEILRSGRIGPAHSILGYFSYFNRDAANIRNIPAYGGGALMDIGCYLVNTSRFIFDEEPRRVIAAIERDPEFGVDRLTSMLLEYPSGHAAGTCSTQMVAYQRVHIFGTRGRIEIDIPFNAPPDRPCRLLVDDGSDLSGGGAERVEFETCDQYRLQGDRFSQAIRERAPAPYPLEDSVKNMAVIDALFRSAASGRWEIPTESSEPR
jgi:predicted dehydrogenase